MKERPILFSAPMVQAILDGRKTQTRRAVKIKPVKNIPQGYRQFQSNDIDTHGLPFNCAYGKVGDRLWVRETHALGICNKATIAYRATHNSNDLDEGWYEKIKWRPSIHMPRWASRIDLKITGIRVERLQDISEDDAKAEGIEYHVSDFGGGFGNYTGDVLQDGSCGTLFKSAITSFKSLWHKINGEKSWDDNPYVWVIEFERVKP